MRWVIGIAAIGWAGQAAASEPPANVEVMVLGTYHMANPGLDLANAKADDVLKPQRQKELAALASALAEYKPTKIVVERIAKTPELTDHRYAEFTVADLGVNRDERYQVAYRLAHQLGQKTVYAIDEDPGEGEPDYFPFGKVVEWAKANGREAALNAELDKAKALTGRIEQLQAEGSVAHVLADMNRPEQAEQDQGWYYGVFRYGDTDKQPGAELNAYWYMRNAKIFAKLMTVAKPGDRVLVVYGAGHNYWLRHFARTTPGYANIDPTPYLRKAEAASRDGVRSSVDGILVRAHISAMRFRLSFAEVPDADPKFWSRLLTAHGITVVSARESGIDAEGKIDDIEKALGTTIEMLAKSQPKFGEVSVREPGKRAPLAYVPREPTYF